MKVKLSLLLLVAVVAVTAFAQTGPAGKWTGELSAADGHGVAQPVTVDLKVEGDALSGTVTEGALEPRPIMGASMEGTTVNFRTTRNLGGSDINVNWKGELKGEEMTLTREIGPAPAEATGRGGGGRGGGGGGGAAPAAGGRGGRGGAAAPAAGGQRGAAAAPATPAAPQANENPDPNAAAAAGGGRGGAGRGGAAGGRGGGAAAPARGGGAPAAPPGPTVTLTLKRSR